VVLDTNVIIGYYLSRRPQSANSRVFRLWRDERKLQLIVSRAVVDEYLEVLARLNVAERQIKLLVERFAKRSTVTHAKLGTQPRISRDPEDNPILATAMAGKVKFLVTNDRDLLDISAAEKQRFKFEIVTPAELLARLKSRNERKGKRWISI
jgi:putative PIN family toxin of toxin-antitoxin system